MEERWDLPTSLPGKIVACIGAAAMAAAWASLLGFFLLAVVVGLVHLIATR